MDNQPPQIVLSQDHRTTQKKDYLSACRTAIQTNPHILRPTDVERLLAIIDETTAVLVRVSQDINWMQNEQKILNPCVFDYLYTTLDDLTDC